MCFGIEIMENPARYAVKLLSRLWYFDFCYHNGCIFENLWLNLLIASDSMTVHKNMA